MIIVHMVEKNFIHRLQQRENRAYVELYDYYFARLHRLAANYVFDVETAKDIVQSVFVSLYERIDTLGEDMNLGAYLSVTVRNNCLNYLRDRRVEDKHKTLYLQASEQADALDWLDDEEVIANIKAVIAMLPDKYRKVCELRFYGNLPYSEIAAQLKRWEKVLLAAQKKMEDQNMAKRMDYFVNMLKRICRKLSLFSVQEDTNLENHFLFIILVRLLKNLNK